MKAKPLKAAHVVWEDATTQAGWHTMESNTDRSPATIHSIGWVVEETPEFIAISHTKDADDSAVNGFMSIPKGWIRRRKNVKL